MCPLSITILAAQPPMLDAMPISVHGLSVVAITAGVVLWLLGSKVVKPIFAILGLVIGSGMGFVVAPVVIGPDEFYGVATPIYGLAGGALVGLIGAIAMFRFTIAIAAAVVFATASIFGATIYLQHVDARQTAEALGIDPRAVDVAEALEPDEMLLEGIPMRGDESGDDDTPKSPLAEKIRIFLDTLAVEVGEVWRQIPPLDRLVMLGGGAIGAAIGLLFGLVMPKRSAALVTALAGSAMLLAGMTWMSSGFNMPGAEQLAHAPKRWVIVWLVLALLGFVWQIRSLRKARRLAE